MKKVISYLVATLAVATLCFSPVAGAARGDQYTNQADVDAVNKVYDLGVDLQKEFDNADTTIGRVTEKANSDHTQAQHSEPATQHSGQEDK